MTNPFYAMPPFPWFGGKRDAAAAIWERLGKPEQYIEPFCGGAAVLLACPEPATLEVVGDSNGFIANFWRAVQAQPDAVARAADYPVSHIDLGARHTWLMQQRERLGAALQDCHWRGDAEIAGWWLWGQCAWIGGGWCDWSRAERPARAPLPGIQAVGQIPHISHAGLGVQAVGRIPFLSFAGQGIQAVGKIPAGEPRAFTVAGDTAREWLRVLSARLARVRLIHGDWRRAMNTNYAVNHGQPVAIVFDPPYKAFEKVYGTQEASTAGDVEAWCREHAGEHRIALCGHVGDYDLPGWEVLRWSRTSATMGSNKTRHAEAIYFSPRCHRPTETRQRDLFGDMT
jgi:hypothetical protein